MKKLLLAMAFVASGAAFAAPAHAIEDYCVRVKKTPDRFLAIRAKPTVDSAYMTSVIAGTILDADTRGAYDHPKWTHITGRYDGWVATKYVEVVECPYED